MKRVCVCLLLVAFAFLDARWWPGASPHKWSAMTPAAASLIASSKIQYCTNDGSEPIACTKKMVVTLTVDAGQLAGTEEIVAISSAADDTDNGATARFAPLRLTTSRSLVRYRYPVFYVQAYNAKPYELIIPGTLFGQCNADFDANRATCGLSYNSDGTSIPLSQGFCCDCGLCSTLGLCTDDIRAIGACNLIDGYTQASCLRFASRWYSGYNVGTSSTYYTINVTMTRNTTQPLDGNVGTVVEENATLSLSPDLVGASNAKFGVMARLIGDFNPTEQPLVLTQSMLFVPSLPRNDERVRAGTAEWMILDKNLVTLDGRSCDKVGVSYEAFASQGNACRLSRGSCLNSQLEDLRTADQQRIAAGRKGLYMARSLGNFFQETYANATATTEGGASTPYISYLASTPAATMLTLTLSADDLQYVVSVAEGKILSMSLNLPVLDASTRDGVMRVEVQNTGAIVARFTLSILCDDSVFPIAAQVVSLNAQQSHNLTFAVYVQRTDVDGEVGCTATLRDSQENVQDVRDYNFEVRSVQWGNGTQGGTNDPANNTTQTGKSQATCGGCGFLSVACVFRSLCWKFIIGEVALLLGIITVLLIVVRCRHILFDCFSMLCCCCGGGGGGDGGYAETAQEKRRRRQKQRARRNRPAYMASSSTDSTDSDDDDDGSDGEEDDERKAASERSAEGGRRGQRCATKRKANTIAETLRLIQERREQCRLLSEALQASQLFTQVSGAIADVPSCDVADTRGSYCPLPPSCGGGGGGRAYPAGLNHSRMSGTGAAGHGPSSSAQQQQLPLHLSINMDERTGGTQATRAASTGALHRHPSQDRLLTDSSAARPLDPQLVATYDEAAELLSPCDMGLMSEADVPDADDGLNAEEQTQYSRECFAPF